jgi:two-component system, NtrC family, sensor kinase
MNHSVRVCGYALEEMRGKKPGQVLQGPESDPVAIKQLHDAVHSVGPCECQIINYKKDGTPYPVYISLGPIFSDGKLEGFLSLEQDLSEKQKRARPAFKTSNEMA